MNYYEHHLGDYMRDTAHLSLLEDGAYRRLIDAYYVRERPLPADVKECCKLARAGSRVEREAVAYVLGQFFELTGDGYRQKRCDEVIAKYSDKKAKASASANARWSQSERNANASKTHVRKGCDVDAPNPQSPVTSTQEERNQKLAEARGVPGLDLESFDRWLGYRAKRRPAINTISLVAAAQELAKFGAQQAEVVQHSIANTYQGLVPPKVNGSTQHQESPRRAKAFGS